MEITTDVGGREVDKSIEIVATVLLGVATVAIALATFRGTVYDDRVAEKFHQALVAEGNSNDQYGLHDTTFAFEQSLFVEWVVATVADNDEGAFFIERAMDEPLREATIAWFEDLETDADTPFDYDDTVFESDEILELAVEFGDEAVALEKEAEEADKAGDRLGLAQVLYAVTLFSAGMAVILTTRKTQQAALLIGCAVLVAGSVFFALGESM